MNEPKCGPIRPGCYVDDPSGEASRQRYVTKLHDIGYRRAHIMIEGSRDSLDVKWSPEELARFARHAEPLGIERVVTLLPEPTKKYVDEVRAQLPAVLESLGTVIVEPDVEGWNWKKEQLAGFRT